MDENRMWSPLSKHAHSLVRRALWIACHPFKYTGGDSWIRGRHNAPRLQSAQNSLLASKKKAAGTYRLPNQDINKNPF